MSYRSPVFPVVLAMVVMGLAGCLAGPGADGEPSSAQGADGACAQDDQSYRSEAAGFSLCVPAGWTFEEDVFGAVVALYREADLGTDFVPNVNVYTEPASPGEGLEESREAVLDVLPRLITDWELQREGPRELGGRPAHEFVYHGRQGDFLLTFHQVMTIKDGTVYVWTHTVERDSGALDDPEADRALWSFTFL